MKVLFSVSHFGFLRNFELAVRQLAERGHTIHLVADRKENIGGMRTVENLVAAYPEAITYGWAPGRDATWHALAVKLRLCLDYWRYLDPRYNQSPKLRARAASQAPRIASLVTSWPLLGSRPGMAMLGGLFRQLERSMPSGRVVDRFLREQHPDLLLVTPLLYFGSSQVDYVRGARALGIPTMLCVGSWDHLTTKGLVHAVPDRVTVWNDAQRQEAQELHGIGSEQVTVTGAQSYDHWFVTKPSVSREVFCRRVGLPADRVLLLYLCSSPFIAPYEVGFVRKWIDAIRHAPDSRLREAALLVRPHPQNAEQWQRVDLSSYGSAAIWPRLGANPVDTEARAEYFDSMYYSAAVVGVNTSALIESAIVGRPVYTVTDGDFEGTQEGTLHFRYLRSVNGGLLHVASTLDAHLTQLAALLSSEETRDDKGRNFLAAFVRPQGLDRPAAPILVEAIESAAMLKVRPERPMLWRTLVRVPLYPAALAARWSSRRRKSAKAAAAASVPSWKSGDKFSGARRPAGKARRPRISGIFEEGVTPPDGMPRPENVSGFPTRDTSVRSSGSPSAGHLKILFAMASPEYLRYYDSTIRLLASRGHQVAIGVNHQREKKPVGLEGLGVLAEHVAILGVIPRRTSFWRPIGRRLRGLTDFVRYLHPRFAEAPALRARIKRKVLHPAFRGLDRISSLPPPIYRAAIAVLAGFERAIPSSRTLERFLQAQAADVVLVSPLVDAASDQVDLLKSAKALGIPVGACIASWDNLTNKGLLRLEPDLVVVWNEIQKAEAVELHGVRPQRVAVTGAQLFDRWFERRAARDRAAFCARVGLPLDVPFVLFTGSSSFIAETDAEVAFVRRWIAAIRSSDDVLVRDLAVLVRPHPYNAVAWQTADLSDLADVAVFPRRGYSPIDEENRTDYFDSLFHAAAIVGINTSAMIEAAILGRPVFSILTPEFAGTQDGTLHFHYLLPENGGFVRLARSLPEHVALLADTLRHPEAVEAQTARFVRSFIRPYGLDVPCTPIVANTIEAFGRTPTKPERAPLWAFGLRPILFAVGAVVSLVTVAVSRKARGKLVKRLRVARHHARKNVAAATRSLGARSLIRRSFDHSARRVLRALRRARYTAAMRIRHRDEVVSRDD